MVLNNVGDVMEEVLIQVSEMINSSDNIPEDIKEIVKAICRGYVRESNGKISFESIEKVCKAVFVKINRNDETFTGENKIFGMTDTMYDEECNVIHEMSYVNDDNFVKLITILCHELGHVMTEFEPCSINKGVYGIVKRTAGFFVNCNYDEKNELRASGIYGFRVSDGFLESICSRIFAAKEFREELMSCGYDLEDYVYKDERLFSSRVYDEYKACFELADYIMDGELFNFACRKYETNEEIFADINKYKLNIMYEYFDKSNDALWALKRYEGKDVSEEFQELLEDYKSKKEIAINMMYALADVMGKSYEDEKFLELLDVYESVLDRQKLLPIESADFGTPLM